MSTPGGDDLQRDMERRALKNVRGLVDKIEDGDTRDRRTQVRLFVAIIVGTLVILLVGLFLASRRTPERSIEVVPAKPGQVMPQAPKAPQ